MPPRSKRPAKRSRKDESEEEEDLPSSEASEPEVEQESDDVEEEEAKPKKKRTPPRPKKAAAAPTLEAGWQVLPTLLFKSYGDPQPNQRIAAFDLDGTMVNVKSTAKWPKDAHDYKWWNKHTIAKIKSYHDEGYKVVVFTNQGSIKSAVTGKAAAKVKDRIDNVMAELGIPAQVFAAPADDCHRKPDIGMWTYMCNHCNGGIQPDKAACFFVGDAAGRPGDFSDSDKGFAAAVGIEFRTPEDEFGAMDGKKALLGGDVRQPAAKKAKGEDAPEPTGSSVKVPENKALVEAFTALADKYFEQAALEGGNAKFKAIAAKKAGGMLAQFWEKITLSNLKEVGKLQGVGKGSIAKIKEFLETGTIAELEGRDDLAGVGKAAPAVKDAGKDIANKFM
ncbi:hypothetical protein GPECTOR_5g376 [Gonium pectorale]|uniref:DNA polymerase beta-like N-terminal domain-containing protein n=1 Tax=Gonium pectorale TaxID=33097 RepID=A0A150GWV6_GONPE|nr:hypothetical protein GPECTOR_5g376 [Gonium pectorale]|eukprot:KXZ54289.1 hypothetical protein GPECTOR_5g376 [Gonium pectorale]